MRLGRHNSSAWNLDLPVAGVVHGSRRRGIAAPAIPDLPEEFLLDGVEVAVTRDATPTPVTRGLAAPLQLDIECRPGERAIVATRRPSGALTFHAPVERVRTRGARRADAGGTDRFRIPMSDAGATASGRAQRGLISTAIKVMVLKVRQQLIDAAVAEGTKVAIQALETMWWRHHQLEEGWHHVDAAALRTRILAPATVPATSEGERALLFIHGTFSNAASAFGALADATGDFFSAVRPLYGDRMYAFDHFTLSRTPAENARMLLESLPRDGSQRFDVITHSRGGLVLRHLVERRDLFGSLANRFRLGHAILVASPNAGTPLATPSRWEQTVGLVANLLEMFPDNPWTTGAEFVANGIVWLAGHVGHDVPGIASMDGHGEVIGALETPPGPPTDSYSALVANYSPDGATLARLLDVGVDGFFAGANDLVVPTEGGWRVDGSGDGAIPARRVGCFGAGGNLTPRDGAQIMHLNFFSQPATVDFLVRTLRGDAPTDTAIDLDRPLPIRPMFRGTSVGVNLLPVAEVASAVTVPVAAVPAVVAPAVAARAAPSVAAPQPVPPRELDHTLQVIILRGQDGTDRAQIVAMYGSARVVQPFPTRNPRREDREPDQGGGDASPPVPDYLASAGSRFERIIKVHETISMSLEGRVPKNATEVPRLPSDSELRDFGTDLFDALFHHDVKRLYDVARSEQCDRPLNVIFTCTIPWVASKPWEFAYDPARRKFFATEEVHFVRNVFTPVPAQRPPLKSEALRMLVVVAQPLGTVALSTEEEEARIRGSFRTLIDNGLVEIEVLAQATPARLHHALEIREFESRALGQTRPYHIVHFIGHGDFDRDANQGILAFTTATGEIHRMRTRELREVLCGRGIQLVFLNACDSARDAVDASNRGVAQALVEGGLPAVVANQYKVLDPSAVAFAEHFYWALAHGASLGEACREARIALNYSIDGEIIDWAVPVLHARDPDLRLCSARERVVMLSAMATDVAKVPRPATRAARSAAANPPLRVAVADLTQAYPGLETVIAQLNRIQDLADFALVRVVLPLGIWRDTAHGTYLNADRFAERLLDRQKELRAHYLICITDHPLVGSVGRPGDLVENLFAWGDPSAQHKIFVISTAGFPIPPEGPVTNRVFANLLVATLSEDLLHAHVHEGLVHGHPPRECPFYYNQERDFALLGGRLAFDRDCREKIERNLTPEQVTAIDTMLGSFFESAAPPLRAPS